MSAAIETPVPPQTAAKRWRWGSFLFLWGIFYLAAPLDVKFTTTDVANEMTNDLTTEDRAEFNVEAVAQGNWGRRIALTALAAFGAISLMAPSERRVRLQGLTGWAILFFLVWTGISVSWSGDYLTTIRKLTVLGSLALGALGFARLFSGRQLIQFTLFTGGLLFVGGLASELLLGTFHPTDPNYRFAGLTWPAFSAWMMSLLIVAGATLYPSANGYRGRLVVLMVAALVALVMTKTRAGVGGFALAVALGAAIACPPRRVMMAALALLVVGLAGALALELAAGDTAERLFGIVNMGRAESAGDISGRSHLWQDLLPYLQARPLIGYGYDSFWTPEHLLQIGEENWGAPDAHNGYLNLALGTGIIGAGAYIVVLLLGIGRSCLCYRATRQPEYFFAFLALVILAVNSTFVSTQLAPALYSFIALVALARLGCIEAPEDVSAGAAETFSFPPTEGSES